MGLSLKGIFGDAAKATVGTVLEGASNIISKFKADPTKVAEYEKELEELRVNAELKATELSIQMEEIALKETQAYLNDTADARATYAKVQESEKSSWLAKNIMPVLTIVVTVGFFGLLGYMLKYEVPKSNERIMDILLGSLGTAWITMVSFYFGSSKSSEDKSKHINEMMKQA